LQNGKKKVIRKIGKPTISESGKVDKIIGAILDITQERKDQEAILIKQEQFASFITNTPAAIAIFDTKLNYIAYSQHWIDSLLIKEQDLVGKNHYEVLPYIPQKWKEINDLCLKEKFIILKVIPLLVQMASKNGYAGMFVRGIWMQVK
jgi:PAS domain-containing protein